MIGIGVDICEVNRFDRLKEEPGFLQKIFTEREIGLCSQRKRTGSQCFAVRFAAKEAFTKALGTGISSHVHLKEIEVLRDEKGKPYLEITGETRKTLQQYNYTSIHISLSHEKSCAIAMVIIE